MVLDKYFSSLDPKTFWKAMIPALFMITELLRNS